MTIWPFRVDELTKLIEDEVIADQQPNMGHGQPTMIIDEEQFRRLTSVEREGSWPEAKAVVDQKVRHFDLPYLFGYKIGFPLL